MTLQDAVSILVRNGWLDSSAILYDKVVTSDTNLSELTLEEFFSEDWEVHYLHE